METESHCGYPGGFLQKKYIVVFGSRFQVYFCRACRRYVYNNKKGGVIKSIEDIDPQVVAKLIEDSILENEENQTNHRRKNDLVREHYPLQIR